jgi:hypothetical protein
VNIIDAIHDANLFQPYLGNLTTWQNWEAALSAFYGKRVHPRHKDLIKACTGRDRRLLPRAGFDTALFLTGRRSGKSRVAAIIGAYESTLAGHEKKLAKGERGIVAVCAPTKQQARVVRNYIRAVFDVPLLRNEVVNETTEGFDLANGVSIAVLAGDWRTVRNFTLLAAIVDEAAFFGLDEEAKVRSDAELIRALKPGLATVQGRLIGITSPYARKGWTWQTYKKNFGNDAGKTLVWNCPSRTMNPTLPQSIVDAAHEEDPQSARSEYGGEFRDDVCEFLPRSLIEGLVVKGRRELLPRLVQPHVTAYAAFADLSGGRNDDAALAIGHRADRKVIIDKLCRYRPPCNPHDVICRMAEELRRYNVRRVTGDNYAAEFVAGAFTGQGIKYFKSEKVKSALYLELLPRLCSGEIELPDDDSLVAQLAGLERRTRSGGRDVVDHPPGQHDDLANVVAGLADVLGNKKTIVVGGFGASLERALA